MVKAGAGKKLKILLQMYKRGKGSRSAVDWKVGGLSRAGGPGSCSAYSVGRRRRQQQHGPEMVMVEVQGTQGKSRSHRNIYF